MSRSLLAGLLLLLGPAAALAQTSEAPAEDGSGETPPSAPDAEPAPKREPPPPRSEPLPERAGGDAPAQAEASSTEAAEVDEEPSTEGTVVAHTLHAPVGGRPFLLRDLGVICTRTIEPWRMLSGGRVLAPPDDASAIGRAIDIRVAATADACREQATTVRLVATGPFPQIAPESVVLSLDEGRADAEGSQLEGSVLSWESNGLRGHDVCFDLSDKGERKQGCAWALGEGVSADPTQTSIAVYPQGTQVGPDALFFDALGRPVPRDSLAQQPARIVLQRVWPNRASVDLSAGDGELSVRRPEAIASVSCEPLTCEMDQERITVRGGSAAAEKLQARLQLKPRVKLWDGKHLEGTVTGEAAIVHCPMSVVTGDPYHDNDEAKAAIRLGGNCARDVPRLQFRANGRRRPVLATHAEKDSTLVVIDLGRIPAGELTITATRESTRAVVAAVKTPTREVTPMRAALEVEGFPDVDFIPTNRYATVHVAPPSEDVYAVAKPIPGVYQVRYQARHSELRGDPHAAGLTPLALGIRSRHLPESLASFDLAVARDPLLRNIHGANVPEPLVNRDGGDALVEVRCGGGEFEITKLPLGQAINLPFALRDSCRVTLRRDLVKPENGAQRLHLRIEVFSSDGARREGAVDQVITLVPGQDARHVFVDGVRDPFDRLVVRMAHVPDDTHYLGSRELGAEAPEAKWTAIFGTERARLYATTAFPTGLYRLSDPEHSGVLSLNFGILSRLTWLDKEGHEGMLAMEAGLVVVGIGNAVTDSGQSLTQVGAVVGLGFSVPFSSRSSLAQAALNVHAWLEIDVTRNEAADADGRFAFIFGPSISIGNLGTNL